MKTTHVRFHTERNASPAIIATASSIHISPERLAIEMHKLLRALDIHPNKQPSRKELNTAWNIASDLKCLAEALVETNLDPRTRFPGITADARALGCNRVTLYKMLAGYPGFSGLKSLRMRYNALRKARGGEAR